jgi:hypothetical protein
MLFYRLFFIFNYVLNKCKDTVRHTTRLHRKLNCGEAQPSKIQFSNSNQSHSNMTCVYVLQSIICPTVPNSLSKLPLVILHFFDTIKHVVVSQGKLAHAR